MAREIEEREEVHNFDEECEEGWIDALREFDELIWPIFEKRGYTKGEAHIIWKLNSVHNAVNCLHEDREDSF